MMRTSKVKAAGAALAMAVLAAAQGARAQGSGEGGQGDSNPFERTGFYIGAVVGEAMNGGTENVQAAGFNSTTVSTLQSYGGARAKNPATGGVVVGYRHALHSVPLVLGFEADLSAIGALYDNTNATLVASGAGAAPAGTYTVSNNSSGSYLASIRSHLGYRFGSNDVYFTGGFARIGKTVGDGTLTYTSPSGASTTYSGSGESKDRDGSVIGGGIEHAFSPHLIVRAEYLHYSVNSTNQTYANPISGRQFTVTEGASGHFDNLRFGLIYQF